MIADAFSPSGRALANGVFSWGIYFGYGLAYVIGINLTQLDVLGYSWRASYVIPALPGFVIAALLFVTVKVILFCSLQSLPSYYALGQSIYFHLFFKKKVFL